MQFRLFLQHVSVGLLLILGLSACDSHHPEPVKQQAQTQPSGETSEVFADEQEEQLASDAQGVSLTQVAGQATLPYSADRKHNLSKPSEADLVYAGRYHARIPCSDAFAGCVNNEKEAEYILNLMDDGSVFWTNTSFSRLGSDPSRNIAKIEQTCKQVQWHVHKELNEIMIRCDAADVNLYYQVSPNQDLVMDLNKIWNGDNGRNRKFFKEYPFPEHAYVFKKVD
ncbi:hypothetical protein MN869_12070 [Acinetobacter sp. NIPH1876]|uniref:hypothetical protein n=1 Tax=unclassified Acinetobacter TaxID=196816 RepID=UPI001FAD19D0|nr:hypothetical protein [Acinetobacter sp. NIPH1876]MCJ0829179.1 hypothetical protein [Acinetobacter sp. NIPH1876]